MSWNPQNGWLFFCQPIEYESLSLRLKIAYWVYQIFLTLESPGLFNSRLSSVFIFCRLDWIEKKHFARFFWDVLHYCHEMRFRELLVPPRWSNRGLARYSSLELFCFTPRTLENGGQLLKYNFFIFSIILRLSTFKFFLWGKPLVVITSCDLLFFLILWTY